MYVRTYVRMCASFDEGEAGTTHTVSDVGNGSLVLVSSRSSVFTRSPHLLIHSAPANGCPACLMAH